ncbi:hypothetical protein QUF75_15725 [Desulfococcaceae bacterium HSG7]|nr:hypothetical protein [Desulfococcaceae bacterium HSG7]
MPTKICVNADVEGGILPTLPNTVIFSDCALFVEPQSGKITVRAECELQLAGDIRKRF